MSYFTPYPARVSEPEIRTRPCCAPATQPNTTWPRRCWYSPHCPALAYCSAARFLNPSTGPSTSPRWTLITLSNCVDFRLSSFRAESAPTAAFTHSSRSINEAAGSGLRVKAFGLNDQSPQPDHRPLHHANLLRDHPRPHAHFTAGQGRLHGQPCYPVRRNRCSAYRYPVLCRELYGFRCHLRPRREHRTGTRNRMPVIPPAPMAAISARVAPAVKNDPAMAAAPRTIWIWHLTWPRRLWEQYESQRHQAESHVTEPLTRTCWQRHPRQSVPDTSRRSVSEQRRELCGQCPDGLTPVSHEGECGDQIVVNPRKGRCAPCPVASEGVCASLPLSVYLLVCSVVPDMVQQLAVAAATTSSGTDEPKPAQQHIARLCR